MIHKVQVSKINIQLIQLNIQKKEKKHSKKCTEEQEIERCIKYDLKSLVFRKIQFRLVIQSCLTLCDPLNCSTPGLPVHHQLLEFTQTCVHQVSDAIQPSQPQSSPSPPALNPSQHQSLLQ